MREILSKSSEFFLGTDSHPDDTSYYRGAGKKLGILEVDDVRMGFFNKASEAVTLNAWDHVMELHIPPISRKRERLSEISESMRMLADYIQRYGQDIKYIVGVTYGEIAHASQKNGFHISPTPPPQEVKDSVIEALKKYQSLGLIPKKRNIEDVRVIYQTRDEFMTRFAQAA